MDYYSFFLHKFIGKLPFSSNIHIFPFLSEIYKILKDILFENNKTLW